MASPKVSVIIPVYNGAPCLDEAIRSVLDQTFGDFELIIVSDASPDESAQVVKHFDDPRIKYIEHTENRGANAARNTGCHASVGEILAFLDQDDLFHPDKLKTHVAFLEKNSGIGLSYNARFELLSPSSKMICNLWRPPHTVALADMVLGFPFGPSEMVIRRDWFFRVGSWDESSLFAGGEIDLDGRLWLSGCQFGSVDRALTFRRPHAGKLRNLSPMCNGEIRAREKVFADPRCPNEVRALRNIAFTHSYLVYGFRALVQEETGLAQEFIREAVHLDPTLLEGKPSRLIDFLATYSALDEKANHELVLERVFEQLPEEFAWLCEQHQWAVQCGYLLKGARAVTWGRTEDGSRYFAAAKAVGAEVDETFLRRLTQELLDYEAEFGSAEGVLRDFAAHFGLLGEAASTRRLKGCYRLNQAFEHYRTGELARVPAKVVRAIANNPSYLGNRGALSILVRSVISRLR